MEISNPRRILLLSTPDAPIPELLKDLTGNAPDIVDNPLLPADSDTPNTSLAGQSHNLAIKTSYYTANILIWIDCVQLEASAIQEWCTAFLAPEAREVLSCIGAFIIAIRKPTDEAEFQRIELLLKEVGRVVEDGCGMAWDGTCLVVGVKSASVPALEVGEERWEDICVDGGAWEWVDGEASGRNEFNEPRGIARVKEALESQDWNDVSGEDMELEYLHPEDDDEVSGFGAEAAEMEAEMFGMKQAIHGDDDEMDEGNEDDVEGLEGLMLRMQAMKDMGSGLPEAERKIFAAKAVKDIMKTM